MSTTNETNKRNMLHQRNNWDKLKLITVAVTCRLTFDGKKVRLLDTYTNTLTLKCDIFIKLL